VPHELLEPVSQLCRALEISLAELLGSQLLQLARRGLGVSDGYAVGFIVRNARELRVLSLAHNPSMTADGVLPIVQAVALAPRLLGIDLSHTAMLRRATLPGDGNPHGLEARLDRLDPRAISALAKSLVKTSVVRLSIEGVGMRSNELHLLANAWDTVTDGLGPLRLEALRLGENELGDDGVLELARSLACVGTLNVLDVRSCRVGDRGAAALAGVLETSPRLRVLSVRGNGIGSQGTAALARGLSLADWLAHLDLGRNPVGVGGDAGVRALADVLAGGRAPRLERLSLDGSGLAARHAQRLRKAEVVRLQLPPDAVYGVRRDLELLGVSSAGPSSGARPPAAGRTSGH
jgi:hypothetical protein